MVCSSVEGYYVTLLSKILYQSVPEECSSDYKVHLPHSDQEPGSSHTGIIIFISVLQLPMNGQKCDIILFHRQLKLDMKGEMNFVAVKLHLTMTVIRCC